MCSHFLLVLFTLEETLVLVHLHDWVLHSSPLLPSRSITRRCWRLRVSSHLAALMHHPEDLLIISSIELFCEFVLPSQLLIHDRLVFLFIVGALVPLVVWPASPLICLLSLTLGLGGSRRQRCFSWLSSGSWTHAIED